MPSLPLPAFRHWMRENGIDLYIVPTADPHSSEYIAAHWQTRQWLTGFTGSAGTAVVTADEALLWTDSRYWLQAAEQLEASGFTLMREGEADVPSPMAWIERTARAFYEQCHCPLAVGFEAETLPWDVYQQLEWLAPCVKNDVCTATDPFATLWPERPALPTSALRIQPVALAGMTLEDKVAQLWTKVRKDYPTEHFKHILLTDLADIAWLLNLRAADIDFNPVFYAYLILHEPSCSGLRGCLYTDISRIPEEVKRYLLAGGIGAKPYEEAYSLFEAEASNADEWMLLEGTNTLLAANARQCFGIHSISLYPSPVETLRAVKNETEQAGFRQAMVRDGVAMVKLLHWIDEQLPESELAVSEKLLALRAKGQGFRGLSFETISAYGPHGAIVHYEPTPESNAPLEARSFLLLDSGAQYDDGTTDITRTIPLGPLTHEARLAYTLVLKGHIALSATRFPEGTTGLQLDLAARRAMWQAGYDFGHGTGHGVGSHLCVHEGPHQIRKNPRPCTLVPFREGMVVTNEPGIYIEGRFGVRIENVLLCRVDGDTPYGHFCRFEALTLCPIDLRPVLWDMISAEERAWLNSYHAEVRRRLLPLLDDEADRLWLQQATEKC